MTSDYKIIQDDLMKMIAQLKQALHMRGVHALAKKHKGVSKSLLQRKIIKDLEKNIEELEPTISRIYNPQNLLKDFQIKGYLIYLLKLKDIFTREVETKKVIIKQRDEQMKSLLVRLSEIHLEYAQKKKRRPKKRDEFVLLENMTDRMNRIEQRICTIQNENMRTREHILAMRLFQKKFKNSEKIFRKRISSMAAEAQEHLSRAVAAYEDRERYVNKSNQFEERCKQDIRKTTINETQLKLIQEKTVKYEKFQNLQNLRRYDVRVEVTQNYIEQKVTGLENQLEETKQLNRSITEAAGDETPKGMEDIFRSTEYATSSLFSHLEQVLQDIHQTQDLVDELRDMNKGLLKKMNASERKLRWEIEGNQAKVKEENVSAEEVTTEKQEARSTLDSLYAKVMSLYKKCDSVDKELGLGTEENETFADDIDDSSVVELTEVIEKKILGYLMLLEYKKVKDSVVEEQVSTPGDSEDDEEPIIREPPKPDHLDTLKPRALGSETDLECLEELEEEDSFLKLDELKEQVFEAVEEIEDPEESEQEDEETFED